MVLLQRDDCPFCWKVRLALFEASISCNFEPPERASMYSPQQTVPVLLDGEFVIWDSSVIVEYISDLSPEITLMGVQPKERAMVRLMHTYSDRVAGLGLRDVIFEKRSKPVADQDQQLIKQGGLQWEKTQDWLENAYEEGAYMAGKYFSIADCALVPRFALAETYGLPINENRHPKLAGWFEQMRKRPSFDETKP